MITRDILLTLLNYDPETGKLHWKKRDFSHFPTVKSCNQWNGAWAGKEAFTALDKKGYKVGAIYNKSQKAHRVIWCMVFGYEPVQIDHINGIKSDNRMINMREVVNAENHKNRGIQVNNTSGVSGVHWSKKENRWIARIAIDGKEKRLGAFITFDDAVAIRRNAEKEQGYHVNHGDRIRNYGA